MIIEITILTAPIAVSVEQASPVIAEIGGIGTLIVNNYYSEGGAGGYVLTDADKEAIATLARYDDTEIRALIAGLPEAYDDTEIRNLIDAIEQYDDTEVRALIADGDTNVATYFAQEFGKLAGDVGTINQRSLQNASDIESANTTIGQVSVKASANEQAISTINGTIGDIASVLDAINGEAI